MDTNNLVLLFIAAMNVVTAFLSWRTHQLTQKVEVATNSMKDALVKATGEASHAAGMVEGLAQGAAEKALFNAGVKSEQEEHK